MFLVVKCVNSRSAIASKLFLTDGTVTVPLSNFRCVEIDSVLIHHDTWLRLAHKNLSFRRDSARRRLLCHSRSFKVTDVGTNRKPACDFLLVN